MTPIAAAAFASAWDDAMAACPRHHFLNLDGTTGAVTPASCGASYCFTSESGTRTVGFSAYGSTPEEALQRLVANVRGMAVAA